MFIKSIKQSSLRRILWISYIKVSDEITELENLTYIFCNEDTNYEDTVLRLEEIEEVNDKFLDIS